MAIYTSSVLVTNIGGSRAAIAGFIRPSGGKDYKIDTRYLESGETAVFDIRQMRDEQVADSKGIRLAKNATSGQFDWSSVFGDGAERLAGRAEISSLSLGAVSQPDTESCNCPSSLTDAFISPDDPYVPVGDQTPDTVEGVFRDVCTGEVVDDGYAALSWSIDDPVILSLTTGSIPSQMKGLAAGTSGFTTTVSGDSWTFSPTNGCHSTPDHFTPAGTGTVFGITGIVPSTGQAGGVSAVAISGSGFGATPTINVTPVGIQVSGVTVSSDGTLINASFTIPSGATIGPYSVNVSVLGTDGGPTQTSNSVTFTVTACASITNFARQSWRTIPSTGELDITYSWQSSTGKLSDLAACQQSEYVTYPGSPGTYTWPRPPFGQTSPNPTSVGLNAALGSFTDLHLPPSSWIKPYIAASFAVNQTYQYVCPCVNGGSQSTLGQYTITRSVTQNSNGTYMYTITKSSGESATLNPLP